MAADERFAARMLGLADELFERYPEVPVITILNTLNAARRDLTDSEGRPPNPAALAAVVTERLAATGHRLPAPA